MNRQSQWLFEAPFLELTPSPVSNKPMLRRGSRGATVVELQNLMTQAGFPLQADGIFGSNTDTAVRNFQRSRGLSVDGIVGPNTWAALLGGSRTPVASPRPTYPPVPPGSGTLPKPPTFQPSALAKAAIDFAITQIGVMENPLGSNRGPEVDSYLRAVGLNPAADSYPWCVAFTYFCYQKAAEKLGLQNPHIETSGVLDHWNQAGMKPKVVRVTTAQALANPGLVKPGSLFIDYGSGHSHTGMVIEVANGRLVTIEGNTNDDGSREGIGVFRHSMRTISTIHTGFIDYSAF